MVGGGGDGVKESGVIVAPLSLITTLLCSGITVYSIQCIVNSESLHGLVYIKGPESCSKMTLGKKQEINIIPFLSVLLFSYFLLV